MTFFLIRKFKVYFKLYTEIEIVVTYGENNSFAIQYIRSFIAFRRKGCHVPSIRIFFPEPVENAEGAILKAGVQLILIYVEIMTVRRET